MCKIEINSLEIGGYAIFFIFFNILDNHRLQSDNIPHIVADFKCMS